VKKIGDLLKEYMREKGWLAANPYQPLFLEWEKIAGESLATHARLIDVQKGVLLVEVDHPGWLQILQMRKAPLLEAARSAAPLADIVGLRARLGDEHGGSA
jgi:predicted nucleic acid-binding Zn ribbon protein